MVLTDVPPTLRKSDEEWGTPCRDGGIENLGSVMGESKTVGEGRCRLLCLPPFAKAAKSGAPLVVMVESKTYVCDGGVENLGL